MNFKALLLVLFVVISVNFTCSWSSTVNGILRPRGILTSSLSFDPNMLESMASGAQDAIDQCREAFKWDRWNCPESAFTGKSGQPMTREKSYTDAVITAGIVHKITRNCAKGAIKDCGCDLDKRGPNLKITLGEFMAKGHFEDLKKTKDNDWYWGGCSEDTTFAQGVVQRYFDEDGKSSDLQALVNRHNQRIGREIIQESMVRKCRCYGVTGSCAIQTCWMEMVPFAEIATLLKGKYDKAVRVTFEDVQGALSVGNNVRRVHLDMPKLAGKLLYLEKSPDYCKADSVKGWEGAKGRVCSRLQGGNAGNVTLAERKSCRNLCRHCGLKVRKQKKTINYRCNCKFVWCCEVKCEVCVKTVDEFFCK